MPFLIVKRDIYKKIDIESVLNLEDSFNLQKSNCWKWVDREVASDVNGMGGDMEIPMA